MNPILWDRKRALALYNYLLGGITRKLKKMTVEESRILLYNYGLM